MQKVSFAVVGIRNFAKSHIRHIKTLAGEGIAELSAVVVREPELNEEDVRELQDEGVAIYRSYEELLEKGRGHVDIITLPTAIHSHYDMAIQGMEAGYNLVLEKPPVPTVQQLDSLMRIEKETGRFCSIGFQMIHSHSLRRLKELIVQGELGEIKVITCRGYWPRDNAYYGRNKWAGQTVVDGQLVLDGPMHNALAHYLNNMIFLAGSAVNESADLRSIRAEMYRSRPFIEADDTSCLEAETTSGTKIYFYVTHSPEQKMDPVIEIVGTKGSAVWLYNERAEINYSDGTKVSFDSEGIDPWLEVMRTAVRVQNGELKEPYSTLRNSRSFVVAINGAYDSSRYIRPIPEQYVTYAGTGDEQCAVIPGIDGLMDKACAERKLLSDLDIQWAHKTQRVLVEDYASFNPYRMPEYEEEMD